MGSMVQKGYSTFPRDESPRVKPKPHCTQMSNPLHPRMYLITAATQFELAPFLRALPDDFRCEHLITGVGPVETTLRLTLRLAAEASRFAGVINLGVAGAYPRDIGAAGLLDICLAEREVLGDFGICAGDAIDSLASERLEILDSFALDANLLAAAEKALCAARIDYLRGIFVTVSCASGSARRGALLAQQHDGLCENMEGAAAARVCGHFGLPLLEVRCISNLVEDRGQQRWRLHEACVCCGETVARILTGIHHD